MTDRKRCSEDVSDGGFRWYQCKRYEWKDGFCKQHHPDTKAERDWKAQEALEKWAAESPRFLKRRIAELESRNYRLENRLNNLHKAMLDNNGAVIRKLEKQLADVGSINLRLMEQLAELREVAFDAKDLLWRMQGVQQYSDDVHYVGGRLNAALNNDKDRVGE